MGRYWNCRYFLLQRPNGEMFMKVHALSAIHARDMQIRQRYATYSDAILCAVMNRVNFLASQLLRLTNLPAVSVMVAVFTSDSSEEAIMGTLEVHCLVKVVHVMTSPCTVAEMIRNRTIATAKIVDAVFFAVSVLTAPIPQGVAFREKPKFYVNNCLKLVRCYDSCSSAGFIYVACSSNTEMFLMFC